MDWEKTEDVWPRWPCTCCPRTWFSPKTLHVYFFPEKVVAFFSSLLQRKLSVSCSLLYCVFGMLLNIPKSRCPLRREKKNTFGNRQFYSLLSFVHINEMKNTCISGKRFMYTPKKKKIWEQTEIWGNMKPGGLENRETVCWSRGSLNMKKVWFLPWIKVSAIILTRCYAWA